MTAKAKSFTLWGFHPAYKGKDGYPYPLPLARGSLRECNGERRRRTNEDKSRAISVAKGQATVPGIWTFGTYATGAAPTGLRLLCDEEYPDRTHEYESTEAR